MFISKKPASHLAIPYFLCGPLSTSKPRYTHISDVFTVAVMALVVKFYSFNDGLMLGTLLAMTFFTLRYSGTQAGVKTAGDARGLTILEMSNSCRWY